MKVIGWIIAIVVASAVGLYFYVKKAIDNLYFTFDLGGINVSNLSLGSINLNINSTVKNDNDINIRFSDLFVRLYYNGTLIAESKDIDRRVLIIPKKSTLTFKEDINVLANSSSINLISKLISKQTVKIDYEVDVKVFGIKIPKITDSFNIP